MNDDDFEDLRGSVPGARTRELTPGLRARESQNVTFFSEHFPIFWESAIGATVTDVDGNRYIDLTSAFGVANIGHSNPYVVSTIADQASRLMHGMGDVHPTEVKAKLFDRLAQLLPPQLSKIFLATTGSEAVEAAMKTAMLATGNSAFGYYRNAYHGLSLGALAVSGIEKFRTPFAAAIAGDKNLALTYPGFFGDDANSAKAAIARTADELGKRTDLAAIIIEPIQGRGGTIVPPAGYLAALRELCTERDILLIFDEIYTGFGRTGTWFAFEREKAVPDILCLGKAMGGGFPISAAIASDAIMDAWPVSRGEALHTSTYLGNPMGCAAALSTIDELDRLQLPAYADKLGHELAGRLDALRSHRIVREIRGRGLLWAIDFPDAATAERVVVEALAQGVIALQAGPDGNAVSIAPPLVITDRQLHRAIDILESIIAEQTETTA